VRRNSKVGLIKKYDPEIEKDNKLKEVWLIKAKNVLDSDRLKGIKNLHEMAGHRSEESMINILRGAKKVRPYIEEILKRCKVCQKFQPNKRKPKVSAVKARCFNDILTLDLKIKIDGKSNILWMIDSFSRYAKGLVVKTKTGLEITKGILNH
jgi:hypothetical protein